MTDQIRHQISKNLASVRERIAAACQRANRTIDSVTLVAVTKYAQMDWVRELVELGVTELAESRPQQLTQRAKELSPNIRWHMIGHLQRNKADDVVAVARLIHSVDSLRLFEQLVKCAKSRPQPPQILLEVNVSGEASKDGFDLTELMRSWPQMRDCESLQIAGLMTMAPLTDDTNLVRTTFRRLRELRDQLRSESAGCWSLDQLSMGMSGDFEIAIEEGATMIRVGSSLFEGLEEKGEG